MSESPTVVLLKTRMQLRRPFAVFATRELSAWSFWLLSVLKHVKMEALSQISSKVIYSPFADVLRGWARP